VPLLRLSNFPEEYLGVVGSNTDQPDGPRRSACPVADYSELWVHAPVAHTPFSALLLCNGPQLPMQSKKPLAAVA
jgi:hypothetical protein